MTDLSLTAQAKEHRKFAVAEGDHLTMLNVYEAFIKVCSEGAGPPSALSSRVCPSLIPGISNRFPPQHQKSSQWCQKHFLNYKGLQRALTVREQLRRLMNKFKVPRTTSEGSFARSLNASAQIWTFPNSEC